MHAPVLIEAVDPLHHDALALLEWAADDARALYPELFRADSPPPTNAPAAPGSVYLVAYQAGVPLGCGALRPLAPAVAEIRRMYVSPAARRRGVASALLQELERHALGLGYRLLRLETGRLQVAALALYAQCGYRRIAAFAPYMADPASICFEKRIDGR